MFSLVMGDVATNRLDPRKANAICNAGGKLLKVVEMQHRYGTPDGSGEVGDKTLKLG